MDMKGTTDKSDNKESIYQLKGVFSCKYFHVTNVLCFVRFLLYGFPMIHISYSLHPFVYLLSHPYFLKTNICIFFPITDW